jgi:hypothetical protein
VEAGACVAIGLLSIPLSPFWHSTSTTRIADNGAAIRAESTADADAAI